MPVPFLASIDLNKNELLNARIQNLAADPGSPVEGQVYYNTTDKTMRQFNATASAWRVIGWVGSTTPVAEAVGSTAVVGSAIEASRVDHRHAMPGLATAGVDGFMPGTDKTKLDAATASATVSTLALRDGAGRLQAVDPLAAQDVATKNYVDALVSGLDAKASCIVATTAALAITARTSTTLTLGGTALTIDGISLANGDRVLVKNSTTGTGAGTHDNGIYAVGGIGSSVVLTRGVLSDTWDELRSAFTFIERGTVNSDQGWVCTVDSGGTLGTTAVAFVQFSSAGAFTAANDPGSTGTGVYDGTVGSEFRFRAIRAASTRVTVTLATKDINIDVVEANLTLNNIGGTLSLAKMATVATGTVFYRTTAGTGSPEVQTLATLKTDLGLAGTNSGDQTITLTGNVTGSGTGSFATTIAASAVTLAMQANIATNSLLGRTTAAAGVTEVITVGTGLTFSALNLSVTYGSSGTTACVGNDARLSDSRTPTAHVLDSASHTISGKTAGQVLLATAATTFAFTSFSGDATLSGAGALTVANAAITLAKQANVATGTVFYRTTAGAGAPEVQTLATLKTDLGLTGTNTGDQTITLTGNVTGSGTGSFATTIAASAVTLAKMANIATNSLLGRTTAATGVIEVITVGTGLTFAALNLSVAYGATGTTACVGNDARLSDSRTPTAHVLDSASHTISGKTAGQVLLATAAATFAFTTISGDATLSGAGALTIANSAVTLAKMANVATSTFLGRVTTATGVVEALTGTQATTLLNNFTSALKGLAPASGGGTVNFLRADGTWVDPSAAGSYAVDFGDASATVFVITHSLGTRDVAVQVYRTATPWDTIMCDVERTSTTTITLRFAVAPSSAQFRAVVQK